MKQGSRHFQTCSVCVTYHHPFADSTLWQKTLDPRNRTG